jgi:hypothetical protein
VWRFDDGLLADGTWEADGQAGSMIIVRRARREA